MKHLKILFLIVFVFLSAETARSQCIALISAPGTDDQTVCINTSIATITYLVVPTVTGVVPTNLPPGVSGVFSALTLTYTITGSPTAVGAYTYSLQTSGCVGVISGAITVIPDQAIALTSAPGTNSQTVCANSPITNITYSVSGSGTGANVTGLPSGVTGSYSAGIFTISGTPSASVSGVFNYTVTTTGSCNPATALGTITVNALPNATASNNGPVCVGDQLTLTGGPSGLQYSYSWTGPAGFSSSQQNPVVSNNATLAMAGTYSLTVTNNLTSCHNSATTEVVVNDVPVASASSNSPVCVGSPINLIGGPSGSYTYLWTGPNGFSSNQQNPVIPSATASMGGTYTLTVSSGSCQGTASTNVTVNSLPAATASSNSPVCVGTTLSLTGGPSGSQYSYSWTGPQGFGSNQMSPTVSTSATLLMAGTYTLTVTNNNTGCRGTATTNVTVNPLPVATASSNSPVCVGSPLILAGGPSGMNTYSWTGPNGFTSNTRNPTVSSSATISMAGTYTLTVTNSNGCLGTASTTVVVNAAPVATASNNGPVCTGTELRLTGGPSGMISYSWSGPGGFTSSLQNPTVSAAATTAMAGVYTLTVTNGTNCSSTATTSVVVNPSPVAVASNNGPLCVGSALNLTGGPSGMTTYSWTGPNNYTANTMSPVVSQNATLTMGGIYTLTVTNSNGCRDTATTLVNIYAVPVAEAGNGGTECDLNFILNAVPSVGTGTWTMVTGPGTATFVPNANAPGARVNVTAYGTYTFRWTETNGPCSSSEVVTVNFYQQPVANAGAGGNQCDLNFTLGAVPSTGTGTWTMTSGTGTATFAPNANSPTATVTVSTYGTKVFTWTEVNGTCTNSAAVTVNFYQQPVAEAGPGGNNCGNVYSLNAVPSVGTGTWSRVSGPGNVTFTPNANTPNAKANISVYGVYVLRWTETNGSCSSFENITVTFIQQPSANAGNGGIECDRDFILGATAVSGGVWSLVSGPGTAVFSPNASTANARVTVSQFGAYDFAWTISNSLCNSSDIVRVTFNDLPVVNAGPDLAVCKGNSIQLNATGSGTFLWTPGNLLNNANIYNPVATPVITTRFIVNLTDQSGCKNSDTINVEVRLQPTADAGPDQILDYLFETKMQASVPGPNETGEWTLLSGKGDISDFNDPESEISDLDLGDNNFIWTITNGVCPVASDTVNILVRDLLIPTLITPNQDGKNDLFIIRGIETLGKTSLTVFNRWGTRVFENNEYDNKWNGVDDNENQLPNDTYFFVLRPERSKALSGYVVIRR
ncbi:MAG: T9SS type B sorting domain-containing protein [Bacteroidales bacterium]|nr:T9SS type B sorting domain-containing protein [Bacteroidales bacterium]